MFNVPLHRHPALPSSTPGCHSAKRTTLACELSRTALSRQASRKRSRKRTVLPTGRSPPTATDCSRRFLPVARASTTDSVGSRCTKLYHLSRSCAPAHLPVHRLWDDALVSKPCSDGRPSPRATSDHALRRCIRACACAIAMARGMSRGAWRRLPRSQAACVGHACPPVPIRPAWPPAMRLVAPHPALPSDQPEMAGQTIY